MVAKKNRKAGQLRKQLFSCFRKGMSVTDSCREIGAHPGARAYTYFREFQELQGAKPAKAAKPKYEAVVVTEQPKPAAQGGNIQLLMGSPADIAEVLRRMK